MQELNDNNIQIYKIPDCDSDEDEEFKTQNKLLKVSKVKNKYKISELDLLKFFFLLF